MALNSTFSSLVKKGLPTGQVIAADRFMITVDGLDPVPVGSSVVFEDGSMGLVQILKPDKVTILNLQSEQVNVGQLVVSTGEDLSVHITKNMEGHLISPLGQSLDSNETLTSIHSQPIFVDPPAFMERGILDKQLETGVTLVDTLFPIVLGQRIAVMGDSRTGKTTFLTQVALNQAKNGLKIIYVMIGKRKADVEQFLARLKASGAEKQIIIVLADVFDALPMTYLAPYAGCAIGDYFWHNGHDVLVVYDDLTNHAKAYRELALLMRANPGREAYPGDMFHAHSSLLERAGMLQASGKTFTALPIAMMPNNDISGYLSTSLISITDGQIVFDSEIVRSGLRPAVNLGLSVSRVGGRGQSPRARDIASRVATLMADYRSIKAMNRFVSETSQSSQMILRLGDRINALFEQLPTELFGINEQQLLLSAVLVSGNYDTFDIKRLKQAVKDIKTDDKFEDNFDQNVNKLLAEATGGK